MKLLSGAWFLAVCLHSLTLPAAEPTTADPVAERIYGRAEVTFESAVFLKPAEPAPSELSLSLAPLLLRETKPGPVGPAEEPFGSLVRSNGTAGVDLSKARVYYAMDVVELNGKPHARVAYYWCFPAGGAGTETSRGPAVQGVRMTLDTSGRPVIWETLRDETGLDVVYVAEGLELAAATQFGKPVPGRRYSIEAPAGGSRRVIVARVLDDGPAPMGPFVYMPAGSRSIVTLLCRCMPAQVKALTDTRTYELEDLASTDIRALFEHYRELAGGVALRWPLDERASEKRGSLLRWPSNF